MPSVNSRDALIGVLTKMVVAAVANMPIEVVESNLYIKQVVVPHEYSDILDRKLTELQVELNLRKAERSTTPKENVN